MILEWLNETFFLTAVLVFIRTTVIVFFLPFFGDSPTPTRVRVLIAVALSIGLFPIVPPNWAVAFENWLPIGIVFGVLGEILVGSVIGYGSRMLFDGLIMAASLVGYQMGFGTGNLFVPDSNMQMDSFTSLHRIIVILIFFSLQLHQVFISGLAQSFEMIPAGGSMPLASLADWATGVSSAIFLVALKLAGPLLVALLFSMAALGLIARTVPQMNVFQMSFPVGFYVGILVYIAMLPFMPWFLKVHYSNTLTDLSTGLLSFLK